MTIDPQSLHAHARAYATALKAAGAMFDKKHLRFNDIVEVGLHYSRCGVSPSLDVALAGVREAVDACVIDDPQYIAGKGPLTMIQLWMEGDGV